MSEKVTVIGGGLAGVEAAWQTANAGIETVIIEMKPKSFLPLILSRPLRSWFAQTP